MRTDILKRIKPLIVSILQSRWTVFGMGLICAFAYPPYHYVLLLFLGFSILFYQINIPSKKAVFINSFIFGMGLGMSSLFWIRHALMVDDGAFAFLIVPTVLGFGLLFGIFYAVPAYCSSFFKQGTPRWLAFSAFFVIFEWIRSWLCTGFPWNLTGYVWANTESVLQVVSVGGIYLLSLICVLTFSSLGLLPQKKAFFSSVSILAFCALMGYLHLAENPTETVIGVRLRLVQPNIAQSLKWDPTQAENNFSKLLHLSRFESDNITHIIWPETALPFIPQIHKEGTLRLMSALTQGQTLITGGLRLVESPRKRQIANSLFVFDDLANITAFYDKAHLVPFGEYVPFRDILPLDRIAHVPGDLKAGTGAQTIYIPKAGFAGPQICYEAIFPHEIVDEKRRPEWMINLTNDAWYGISAGPYQHLAIAKTRAVEEGLPLVRATNNGVSAVIDAYGRIIHSLDLGKEGVVDSELPRPAKRTLYAQYGNTIPLGFCVVLLILAFLAQKKNRIF